MKKEYFFFAAIALFVLSCGNDRSVVTDLFPVRVNKEYGYIDRAGKTVIPNKFSKAGCFSDGLAVVASTDSVRLWGYIDKSGNYIIAPAYAAATTFSEGIAFVVAANGAPAAIDRKGVVQFTLDDAAGVENFSEGLAAYSVLSPAGEQWGFVDKKGKTIITPRFRGTGYFSGGLCGVMDEKGLWGYINKRGEVIIGSRYNNVYPFARKRAKVSADGKWGIIDNKGNEIISTQYADIDIDRKQYLVKEGDKWGWVDHEGKTVIPAQFSNAFPFNGSRYAAVKLADKWGYIDEVGKYVIQPRYDFAFGFDGDMALVEEGKKYGFIDKEGNYAVTPAFDNISLDYFIKFFAKTSAFYSLKTNKNLPSTTAWKWLTSFYHLDYDEAKMLSTPDTKNILEQFSTLDSIISDSSKQKMAGVIIGIKEAKENGDRAIVTYTLSDNPGKEELLFLVKNDNKWLVQFTKNDKDSAVIAGNNKKNKN